MERMTEAIETVLGDKRVSGPILITHTKNDKAVGIAYPLASRNPRDLASALGDEMTPMADSVVMTPSTLRKPRDWRDN
jgi:hypothetical protein